MTSDRCPNLLLDDGGYGYHVFAPWQWERRENEAGPLPVGGEPLSPADAFLELAKQAAYSVTPEMAEEVVGSTAWRNAVAQTYGRLP